MAGAKNNVITTNLQPFLHVIPAFAGMTFGQAEFFRIINGLQCLLKDWLSFSGNQKK